jgi:hypothetical protein
MYYQKQNKTRLIITQKNPLQLTAEGFSQKIITLFYYKEIL